MRCLLKGCECLRLRNVFELIVSLARGRSSTRECLLESLASLAMERLVICRSHCCHQCGGCLAVWYVKYRLKGCPEVTGGTMG